MCYLPCYRVFPWVLAVFDLQPYHFYKVIELLIRAEDGFSRDVIKHLNSVSANAAFNKDFQISFLVEFPARNRKHDQIGRKCTDRTLLL